MCIRNKKDAWSGPWQAVRRYIITLSRAWGESLRTGRRILAAALAFALSAAVGGCAQSTAEVYSDFLLNEDVLNRFEICYADIGKGKGGPYTADELRVLHEDLEYGYRTGDEDADRATKRFQEAVDALQASLDEPEPSQSAQYAQARKLFDEGWGISVHVRNGAYDE